MAPLGEMPKEIGDVLGTSPKGATTLTLASFGTYKGSLWPSTPGPDLRST